MQLSDGKLLQDPTKQNLINNLNGLLDDWVSGLMPLIVQVNILRPLVGEAGGVGGGTNTGWSADDTQWEILALLDKTPSQAAAVYLSLSLLSAAQIPQDPLRCAPILIGSLLRAHIVPSYGNHNTLS